MKKLSYIKGKHLGRNKTTFGSLNENKIKLGLELQRIDGLLEEMEGSSEELMSKIMEVMANMGRLLIAEEIF